MKGRRDESGLYAPILLAFLVGLVALGLLGVPAALVAAIGAAVAAAGIAALHRRRAGGAGRGRRRSVGRPTVPTRYVPRVLQSGTARRRPMHGRRHRHPAPPLRFR